MDRLVVSKFFRFVVFSSICLFFACKSKPKSPEKNEQSDLVSYAKHFKLIQHEDFMELQILNPDFVKGENAYIEKKYALTKDSKSAKIPADLIPIQVPIPSIVALNGTDIGMLEKINCSKYISGVSDINYVSNQTVLKNFKQKRVFEIHDFNQFNLEKLIGVSSLVTYSGFGKGPANESKANKLGIQCLPIYDWREIHPLGKAEWIKVLGCLFGAEKAAIHYFEEVEKAFLDLEQSAKKLQKNPRVLSGSMIGDSWFMPAGDSYNAYLFRAAKCDFVGKNKAGTGSSGFTFETVFSEFRTADLWVNPGFSSMTALEASNQKYRYFKAFEEKNVYCYSHNMNYFWENSASEPHHVLSDLIQLFHAGEVPKKELYFYKKLSK